MSFGGTHYPTPDQWAAQQRSDSVAAARRSARAAEESTEHLEQLLDAMTTQLELAKAARADAEQSERFTRTMAWSSLAVAIASLAAAVVAIVVSI